MGSFLGVRVLPVATGIECVMLSMNAREGTRTAQRDGRDEGRARELALSVPVPVFVRFCRLLLHTVASSQPGT